MWDGLGRNKIVKVDKKNSGAVFTRLWAKVHEILGQCRDPLCFPAPLHDCLYQVLFSRYSPLSIEVAEKPNKCKSLLAPIFFREKRPQLFYCRLLVRHTVHRLVKFGWVSFADVRLRILAMKWNAEFTEGGWKLTSNLKPFMDQSSCCFETMQETPCTLHALAFLFCISFHFAFLPKI